MFENVLLRGCTSILRNVILILYIMSAQYLVYIDYTLLLQVYYIILAMYDKDYCSLNSIRLVCKIKQNIYTDH